MLKLFCLPILEISDELLHANLEEFQLGFERGSIFVRVGQNVRKSVVHFFRFLALDDGFGQVLQNEVKTNVTGIQQVKWLRSFACVKFK